MLINSKHFISTIISENNLFITAIFSLVLSCTVVQCDWYWLLKLFGIFTVSVQSRIWLKNENGICFERPCTRKLWHVGWITWQIKMYLLIKCSITYVMPKYRILYILLTSSLIALHTVHILLVYILFFGNSERPFLTSHYEKRNQKMYQISLQLGK